VYALVVGTVLSYVHGSDLTYDASEPNGLQIRIQFPGFVGTVMSRVINRVEGTLAARAVAVFTVNSSDGTPFDRLARYNSNTVILENVPKISEFAVDSDISPIDSGKKTLIYVGGVSERKGGDMMIESMVHIVEDHPDAQLVIIGGGSDAYMAHLRDRIETLGINEQVSLLGQVDYERVPAYLAEATIGYQLYQPDPWTSRSKASSTIFRHMGSGLPVVVTDLPGLGKLVDDLECGITVPVDDPYIIGTAVSDLLADKDRVKTLGTNGRRQVEKQYNWEVEEERFLEHMPVP
jgi:glycosyltransferase involved in cell wall biosynthesis